MIQSSVPGEARQEASGQSRWPPGGGGSACPSLLCPSGSSQPAQEPEWVSSHPQVGKPRLGEDVKWTQVTQL